VNASLVYTTVGTPDCAPHQQSPVVQLSVTPAAEIGEVGLDTEVIPVQNQDKHLHLQLVQ
jgi:hypothetical protein